MRIRVRIVPRSLFVPFFIAAEQGDARFGGGEGEDGHAAYGHGPRGGVGEPGDAEQCGQDAPTGQLPIRGAWCVHDRPLLLCGCAAMRNASPTLGEEETGGGCWVGSVAAGG